MDIIFLILEPSQTKVIFPKSINLYCQDSNRSCSSFIFIFFWSLPSVQSLSRVQLCDTMNRSTPDLPVHHQLPEFTQTHVHRVSDAI